MPFRFATAVPKYFSFATSEKDTSATFVRFAVLKAVKIPIVVVCSVTSCSLLGSLRRFGETYLLHLQFQVTSIPQMAVYSSETSAATYKTSNEDERQCKWH